MSPERLKDAPPTFDVSRDDARLIIAIASRYCAALKALGLPPVTDRIGLEMDLTAAHANGNPLDLAAMLRGSRSDLLHDVAGIQRHIDRATGHLGNCFSPRFSQPERSHA